MAYQGADPVQLRTAAAKFDNAANRLDQLTNSMHRLVNTTVSWGGRDADGFRSQWSNQYGPAVTTAAQGLRQAGVDLRRNADEQSSTSAALGPTSAYNAAASADAPTGTSALFDTLHHSDNSQDGIYIQQVLGADGKARFIVYLNGTDEAQRLTAARNMDVIWGRPDTTITDKIDAALRNAGYQPGKDGPDVMLVGYSQGGMDAQNIAAAGRYHVTDLVTYGSPLTHADPSGVNTVHLRAAGDNVPDLPAEALALTTGGPAGIAEAAAIRAGFVDGLGDKVPFDQPLAGASNHIFEANPGTSAPPPITDGDINWENVTNDALIGNHGDMHTYEIVGNDFDKSTDPDWVKAQNSIAKFQGQVVATAEPKPRAT